MSTKTILVWSALTFGTQLYADDWQPPDSSWQSLFNGKDFTGWKLPNSEHNWQVIDGVIDYEAKGGNLVTEKSFKTTSCTSTGD